MPNKREVIVFDIDKTLIHHNLHELLIERWAQERPSRRALTKLAAALYTAFFFPFARRRIEYLVTAFISEKEMHDLTVRLLDEANHVHAGLRRRIDRYKRLGYPVVLVSATPERVAIPLARLLGADVYASKCVFGVLTKDLLGRKCRVYSRIESDDLAVRTVYSDSPLDFWARSSNFLIRDKGITRVIA